MAILSLCQWLDSTAWSVALRESTWVYPIIESIHVLSLCLFLGFAVILDLRLVGVALQRTRVSEISQRLMPWIIVDDQLIGAIGVGGAAGGDEACGYEALTKVLGPQPPMAKPMPFGGIGNEPSPAAPGTAPCSLRRPR